MHGSYFSEPRYRVSFPPTFWEVLAEVLFLKQKRHERGLAKHNGAERAS